MSFNFDNVEHKLAYIGQKIVTETKAVARVLGKIGAAEPEIEAVTSFLDPQAVVIERAAFQALGLLAKAANDAGAAADAKSISVPLDTQVIQDFKALYQYLRDHLAAAGIKLQ